MENLKPKDWFLITLLSTALGVATTAYVMKRQIPTKELDLAVATAVLEAGAKYCKSINSKNFIARSSGLEAQAGCSK